MPIDAVPLDVGALPGIVCGPIVRRLTRSQVSVWVATVAPDPITLTVREVGETDSVSVTATPAQVGSQLWMTVLTADAFGGEFTSGHTYEYELTAPWEATRGTIPWAELALPGHTRPTFLAPPDAIGDLRLMHTSCRKPHGNGRDAMALAMDELGRRFDTNPPAQPQLLVLSGDQIYADEVGHAVISRIVRIAADLVGIDETDVFGDPPIIAGRGPGTRAFGFTGSTANHLWTYGEFVALYLLMWSPTLWPAVLPPYPSPGPLPPFDVDPAVSESEWKNELENVELFVAVVADVRRVLANVATLMIFDDHEVTDDWNIDHAWVATVYGNPQGRRVVTNALLAYLVCQHWGNRPDRFTGAQTAERRVLSEMEAAAASGVSHADAVPLLLGVPAAAPPAPPPTQALRDLTAPGTVRYDVTLDDADGWPARIVLLDERTAREFPSDQGLGARISLAGLAAQLPPPASPAPLTIVVAASPILGTYVYEDVIQPMLRLLQGPSGIRRGDNEPWSTIPANFQDLLARLAAHHPVLVLSGDVHYGYTSSATRTEGTQTTRVAQFTSSGAKNFTFKHSALGQYGELGLKLGLERPRSFAGYTALSAADRQRLVGAPPVGTALAWDDLAEVIDGRSARDGASTPTALPTPIATAYGLPAPDWSYEIGPVDDPMADYTNPGLPVGAPWAGWQPERSRAVTDALQHADLARLSKMFVGLPNLGVVRVEVSGSTLSVHQELRCPVGSVEPAPPGSRHSVNTTVVLT